MPHGQQLGHEPPNKTMRSQIYSIEFCSLSGCIRELVPGNMAPNCGLEDKEELTAAPWVVLGRGRDVMFQKERQTMLKSCS